MIVVGIDAGTSTGYAEWDIESKKYNIIKTLNLAKAFRRIIDKKDTVGMVIIEDARKRKFLSKDKFDKSQLQGAGSIKAESKIWEQLMKEFGIPYLMVAPKNTKYDANTFSKITGYKETTSSHGRDAAMMIFNSNLNQILKWKREQ